MFRSSVLQGSILGLVLLNIFINDLVAGVQCILSKFADDLKLRVAVGSQHGSESLRNLWKKSRERNNYNSSRLVSMNHESITLSNVFLSGSKRYARNSKQKVSVFKSVMGTYVS